MENTKIGKWWSWAAVALVGAFLAVPGRGAGDVPVQNTEVTRTAIRTLLGGASPALLPGKAVRNEREILRAAYEQQGYSLFWTHRGTSAAPAEKLLQTLRTVDVYGLRPEDYSAATLSARFSGLMQADDESPQLWAELDLALSSAAIRLLSHLHFGRVEPRAAGFDLREQRPSLDLTSLLGLVANADDIPAVLATVEPRFHHYTLLKQALAHYRALAAAPDADTAALARQVRQIELTLERWRWLPEFDTPPIIVNIPQFTLYAFGSTEDRVAGMVQMPVIVGQTYPHTRTPVFVEDMKYVVFRPYWDVPASILKRELLPAMRANPRYAQSHNLEIVRGDSDAATPVAATPENLEALAAGRLRLRQRPGADNSLGLIKFMLPNSYNVYLHSTPAQELFKKTRRTFSHGCIRVSDPVGLGVYVLRNTPGDWTAEKIEAAMNGGKTFRVYLSKPIRVMVLYGTALAKEDGTVLFMDDIYGHDRKLAGLLGLPMATGR